ncbi:transmembrane protein 268 isoform X2 [Xyrichtys novacula]|uniref:Transmembrane protein 268 isoform X2 n=1 Tax=Xyrichtys novacula TaxID=13765 RepID=A0AAV1HEW0_XYRNO|nr:transmembrane protein 268 isoform X2 [Xyrichtys novacula]
MMEGQNGIGHLTEEDVEDVQIRPKWSNGQCVLALPTSSTVNPTFDLSQCRAKLEDDGFEIPVRDLEVPLKIALDVPSVRRYMVFNSALFHFIFAPIDMNLDVRLIQVNERMVKHKLLVAVADWVQNCNGNMKLYFVYWDMSHCLRSLTETLEEQSFVAKDLEKKMKRRMSHLVLVTEVNPEVGGSDMEQDLDEQRPLLGEEEISCSTTSSQREDTKVTTSYSLFPDESLPAQAKAYQLLITYSAAYMKLLVSQRLSNHRLRPRTNHCSAAPLCLCQYIKRKILQ